MTINNQWSEEVFSRLISSIHWVKVAAHDNKQPHRDGPVLPPGEATDRPQNSSCDWRWRLQLGGTWAYTPERDMGLDPIRRIVHPSLYASHRTSLPREVMGFRAFPFSASRKPGRDARRFPGHAEVLEYLKDFADEFRLWDLVSFGSEVCHVRMMEDRKWIVRSRKRNEFGDGDEDDKVYDAMVVCNGHYTEPRIAEC